MTKIRITLRSTNVDELESVVEQIKQLASTLGMRFIGPVRLPRRRLCVTTRRTPCGDGSDTYEHWEQRIYKRLIDIEGDEKYIKQILRIRVPTTVFVKVLLG
jgi:small subunit ribosomal protein S10